MQDICLEAALGHDQVHYYVRGDQPKDICLFKTISLTNGVERLFFSFQFIGMHTKLVLKIVVHRGTITPNVNLSAQESVSDKLHVHPNLESDTAMCQTLFSVAWKTK